VDQVDQVDQVVLAGQVDQVVLAALVDLVDKAVAAEAAAADLLEHHLLLAILSVHTLSAEVAAVVVVDHRPAAELLVDRVYFKFLLAAHRILELRIQDKRVLPVVD
jgi:hypothetical protein